MANVSWRTEERRLRMDTVAPENSALVAPFVPRASVCVHWVQWPAVMESAEQMELLLSVSHHPYIYTYITRVTAISIHFPLHELFTPSYREYHRNMPYVTAQP